MTSSNQKLVQSYLERNGIGQLFEEMMAKLIKDMPNEPLVYLLKFLQRMHKKSEGANSRVISPPLSRGMGLIGSSIPKKHSGDPQVVLPGSKPVVSSWSKNDLESVVSSSEQTRGDRSYDKPWLTNTKSSKANKREVSAKKRSDGQESKSPNQSFNDIFQEQEKSIKKQQQLSKSLPVPAKNSDDDERKDTQWTKDTHSFNKENTTPLPNRVSSSKDDELRIDSGDKSAQTSPTRKSTTTFSPSEYSKVKRHSSKKKAIQQKQKLQALLTTDEDKPPSRTNSESTDEDDEGIDVFEDDQELASEGVLTSSSSGVKRSIHKGPCSITGGDVTVSVCSRCAQLMNGENNKAYSQVSAAEEAFFQPSKRLAQSNVFSDDDDYFKKLWQMKMTMTSQLLSLVPAMDDDIESVSQIDASKPFKPRWPVLSDSDGEEKMVLRKKQTAASSTKSKNVNFHTTTRIETADKSSDFFERNSPLRKKTKQLDSKNVLSDNESEATFVKTPSPRNKTTKSSIKQKTTTNKQPVWAQQTTEDTASDDDQQMSSTKLPVRKGFQLKEADDVSDVL